MKAMDRLSQPSLLGLQPTFGFGDRLGLATPGHIAALKYGHLQPIFAQQSVRELSRTQRTAPEVLAAAQAGIAACNYTGVWGADADHLKTREDVETLAAAGFTFFTIDPSAHVQNHADSLERDDLESAAQDAVKGGSFENVSEVESLYLGKTFDLGNGITIPVKDRAPLLRAIVKYGAAIAYAAQMARWIANARAGKGADIEVSVDETDSPTTPMEHLFIGMELKRRGVMATSVAPRFIGEFEKGIDYKGDLARFEEELRIHVAIARYCGPYKISVHSGSDKFSIYPAVGRVCGSLLHVKTAGTSYLEALRVVARTDSALFREIVEYSRSRFDTDKASYHISARLGDVQSASALSANDAEDQYLDQVAGRQILHVTFGSVLTVGKTESGRLFKEGILEALHTHADLHSEVLEKHLGKHIQLISQG
jgi:hypothetical protein